MGIVRARDDSCNNAPLNVGVRAYRRWQSLQELVVESLVGAPGGSSARSRSSRNPAEDRPG